MSFSVAGRNRARQFTVSAVVERVERLYVSAIADTEVGVTGVG